MVPDHDAASDVVALRPFVPAKDFDTSLRFYSELGFSPFRLGDAMASMQLGPFPFLLHAFDREYFASNFVMHLLVKNVDPWWSRIMALDLAGRYGVQAPIAPKRQPWGLVVAYVFDPSDVLWHIAEEQPSRNRAVSEERYLRAVLFVADIDGTPHVAGPRSAPCCGGGPRRHRVAGTGRSAPGTHAESFGKSSRLHDVGTNQLCADCLARGNRRLLIYA
jgi:uncharacterized glyoxalase superfamily protein PhnB